MDSKKIIYFLIIIFLNIGLSYSNNLPTKYKTVYYYTQQTSTKNGHIVLSFVKSISCEWGSRGEYAIEKIIREDFSNWFRYKPWSKEYRANVYVYESEISAKQARNRIRSSSGLYDDNDKYTDSYRYDCDYHLSIDEEKEWERQQQAKEEERRQAKAEQDRIAAENLRIQNEKKATEEKTKYTNWSNTTKNTLFTKLNEWDAKTQQYLKEVNTKYRIFNGEKLPTYLDIYALLIERTLLSPTISGEEKSAILNRVLVDTYNYYNIYYDYNYNKVVPPDIFKKINTIYAYGKAQFGYHPVTNAYRYLSGLHVTPYVNKNLSQEIKEHENRAISYFNQGKTQLALFEYFSALANYNSSIEKVANSRENSNKELQWRINFGYLLYYNGFFYDAYRILNKERKAIESYYKNSKNTNYWEIYSFEIAALYYSSNYDIAIKEAIKFKEALSNQYPKKDLNDLSTIKITRNQNSLSTNDVSVQNTYSRVLAFWSKSLLRKDNKKESSTILNPIVKLIKKEIPLSFFGNNDNQLSILLKIHEPKLYEKYNLGKTSSNFKKIHQTYDQWEKNTTKKTWEEINAEKIENFLMAYDNKNDNLAVSIAKELLPSLRYDFTYNNTVYKDLMTKAALASTCSKDYESAICFANYAQLNSEKKEGDVAYLLLLTNIILSNNYSYALEANVKFVKPKDDNVKYDFEALLITAASKKYDADHGYIILEHIQQELARKQEKSIYLPYLYNAIKKTKPKSI